MLPVALGYDLSAARYDALVGPSYADQVSHLLDRVVIRPDAAVLDVGCGTGIALLEALRRVPRPRAAVGVDASPQMIARARAKAAALGVPAVFLVGCAERLPFPNAAFDLVICNSALHWFADRAGAVAEMARVLAPSGHLLLIAATPPCCAEWIALLDAVSRRVLGRPQPPFPWMFPTAAEVAACLRAAGLVALHLEARHWRTPVGDPIRFVQAISAAMPTWQAGLTPQEAGRMQAALTLAVSRLGPGWQVTWAAVEAIALRPGVFVRFPQRAPAALGAAPALAGPAAGRTARGREGGGGAWRPPARQRPPGRVQWRVGAP